MIGLIQMGIAKIYIQARSLEKVNSFIAQIKSNLAQCQEYKSIDIVAVNPNNLKTSDNIAAIINASPIGLYGEKAPDWLEHPYQ